MGGWRSFWGRQAPAWHSSGGLACLVRHFAAQRQFRLGQIRPTFLLVHQHEIRHNPRMTFTRITIDPAVCTGKPCIRGLRFPLARLLGLMAAGETREQILKEYPYLESGDIDEPLRYAASLAEDETVELAPTS